MALDARAVAAALGTEPIVVADALEPEDAGGLPAKPGFYAWWITRDPIAGVPHHPHPTEPNVGLIYVGISPTRAGSSGLIRSRVINQHIRGNTSSSTFRYVLAALLLDELGLTPRVTAKKIVLEVEDNARLRAWQTAHLLLTWCERERPWEVEDDVIALMQPPLNCAANETHPFYPLVSSARAAFRAAGRTNAAL